jgi:hypothetical protein
VVPVEEVHGAPGSPGFLSQAEEEIEHGLLVVSTVQDIAGLDQDQLAPDPPIPFIDGSGQAKGRPGRLQVSMKVTDGDDALGRLVRLGQPLRFWVWALASRSE